jgi:hypothetical protein
VIPGGFKRGKPFRQYDWQFWCTANHYRIREDAKYDPDDPPMNQAFVYRLTQVIAPQKTGKGPWAACLDVRRGGRPELFGGWAKRGDVYRCDENGCDCGWYFEYEVGEPMGVRHPSPLIQLTANSQDQVKNVWDPLNSMIRRQGSPLAKLLLPRGEFIRVVAEGATPRPTGSTWSPRAPGPGVGNPISDYLHDESGLYTKQNGMVDVADAQERGAAGMGGRGKQTTNCWDPAEESFAQTTTRPTCPTCSPTTATRTPTRTCSATTASRCRTRRRRTGARSTPTSTRARSTSTSTASRAGGEAGPARPGAGRAVLRQPVRAGGGAWLPDGAGTARRADVVAAAA